MIHQLSFLLSMWGIIENSQNFANLPVKLWEGEDKEKDTRAVRSQVVMGLCAVF